MIRAVFSSRSAVFASVSLAIALACTAVSAQKSEPHWRKSKPLAPAATITVTIERAHNGKPISNAAVIFHAINKEGRDEGSMEIKSDPDGNAKLDIIEVGSHVTVQVIADGYATGATEFDVPDDVKNVVVKMLRPREQVSAYEDNDGKAVVRPAGVQEPRHYASTKKIVKSKPEGLVSGTVSDSTGARITFATVTLRDINGKLPTILLSTKKNGEYRKEDVPAGTYEMTVKAPGYATQTRDGVVVLRDDNQILDVTLPLSPIKGGPVVAPAGDRR